MSKRIVIVDDHQILRDGLHVLIETQLGHDVVGEAENGRRGVEITRQLRPDLVIMDLTMPDMNGIEATREILTTNPGIKIIALSMHSDRRFVSDMLSAGAAGYLLKDCASEELGRAIDAVLANQIYVSPSIAGVLVKDYLKNLSQEFSAKELLSGKERETLQLIAEGISTKEIADRLNVSIKTIETHKQHIMDKIGLYTIAELTKYAIREGITSLDH